jgi:glutaredoxin 3|tara:strand:- start:795 stop:1052 length:258 start_codon:yes stop_codon:yes gene_type:complete
MQKVIIYSGPMCNFCSAAKHLLNKKKVDYTEFDIATNQSKMQEMHEKTNGARTVPQIFIGDTYVGGYQELKALEIAGKLNSLLGI